MTSPGRTTATPADLVNVTTSPRDGNAVALELGGATRGSIHVTGTTACTGTSSPAYAPAPAPVMALFRRTGPGAGSGVRPR